jgi:homogentisate 1,2-dioxygenase
LLIIEGRGAIEVPARYRNAYGQLLEHAPYAQRDIRLPERLETNDESGEFPVLVKAGGTLTSYLYGSHPFDVVGWDGYFYPWALNVADLEPLTGRVHQPPPAHQTFQGANFVVCTFVPRMLDYHPQAVPAPYSHSNVDSDEVLYYASGNFTSRTNVEAGSITLHRHGLPHGPQPGATEASLGAKSTDELAVMVDTFWPLRLATAARQLDDPTYPLSWSKKRP